MQTVTLGPTGLKVPRIAFGAWQLGSDAAHHLPTGTSDLRSIS
jgi:aryl-alcohol dehydrogenase-like predicted oxidoreductase